MMITFIIIIENNNNNNNDNNNNNNDNESINNTNNHNNYTENLIKWQNKIISTTHEAEVSGYVEGGMGGGAGTSIFSAWSYATTPLHGIYPSQGQSTKHSMLTYK